MKCRSKRPLPSGVFCKFCGYIWWYGCVWSPRKCGKVEKKNIVFVFLFFTMKPSRIKNYGESFDLFIYLFIFMIRLVVILFGCQESVGKLKILFSFFFSASSKIIFIIDYRSKQISVIFGKFPDISY